MNEALSWWRTATIKEKARVIKKWHSILPEKDYRKQWSLKRINISDTAITEVHKHSAKN